jgi:8-oxo-dGTP diphosphatase
MKKLIKIVKEVKSNLNGKVVTFDFDHTIVKSFLNKTVDGEEHYQFGGVNREIIKRMKRFKDSGTTVLVVTSRDVALEDPESSVKTILKKLGIEVDGVFYTNGQPKARKLYELGSRLHYDDDPKEHDAIIAFKNLHKDFNITLKYPDELIKDTNNISKGVIVTSDDKIIVAQRSDSFEWDAPGGHIMEGEEAPYSFWREVKEELGLEVQEVDYLDTLEIEWKGKKKLAHYFLGRIDYASTELEGVIELQWEVSEYLVGGLEEVVRDTSDNSTQNLTNVLQMLQGEEQMFESYKPVQKGTKVTKRTIFGLEKLLEGDYQNLMKKKTPEYNEKKKELLNMGPQKTGWAKSVEDLKEPRGESAPPGAPGGGWGALEEEKEEKPEKKIRIKIKTELDEKKRKKRRKKKRKSKKKSGIGGYFPYWDMFDGGSSGDGGGDGGGGE